MSVSATITDLAGWILLVSGSAFVLIGAFGLIRFPDFWSRLHAASVIDSAGMILLVAGMIVQAGPTLVAVKLVLIGVFLFLTGPTGTHAVANAALVTGLRPPGDDAAPRDAAASAAEGTGSGAPGGADGAGGASGGAAGADGAGGANAGGNP